MAPIGDAVRNADLVGRAFAILQSLHRSRRMVPPSEVIAGLFERTRALPTFRLRSAGDQSVANLWKVLDVARAYEAAGPATLRAVVAFLQQEAEGGREEGDSPVGEQAGAQVEVLTVHKAKGLEYPIVIVADLLSDHPPAPQLVVRHATDEGWLKIGSFEPHGWEAAKADEKRQQEAEERRLLYVALTRARDHLVIPCFPDKRREAWLDEAIAGFAIDGREPPYGATAPTVRSDGTNGNAEVTWFDTRELVFGGEGTARTRATAAIDGTDADEKSAQLAEQVWEAARKTRRKAARQVSQRIVAANQFQFAEEQEETSAKAEPKFASETEAELATDGSPPPAETPARRSGQFGRLVHALLAQPTKAEAGRSTEADLSIAARALAPQFGLGEEDAAAAADLANRARAIPEIASAETADLVYREMPFAVPLSGVLATGQIDLAYRKAGKWTLIDFKTADLPDLAAARKAHGVQMEVYSQALAAMTRQPVRAALCLLRTGQLLDLQTGA